MRRAKQCRYFASSLPPNYRHSRLTIVRRGCKRSRLAGIHGEAMYTAPDYPQGVCHIRKAAELPTAVQCAARAALRAPIRQCRGSRGSPLAFLWGFQRGYSLWKENTPFVPRPHGSGTEHRPLWAQKRKYSSRCMNKKRSTNKRKLRITYHEQNENRYDHCLRTA